jgi:hypothetical protein
VRCDASDFELIRPHERLHADDRRVTINRTRDILLT